MVALLEFFYKNPSAEPHLRQLAKNIRASPAATRYTAEKLVNKKVLQKRKEANLIKYSIAKKFSTKKRTRNLEKLSSSKLYEELEKYADCAIVFGSYSRGEDWEESDIDIAVVNARKEFSKKTFDDKPVQIIHITENLPEELQNNIINGIPLFGRWDPLGRSSTTSEKK